MNFRNSTLFAIVLLAATSVASAQQTSTSTNRRGDTVTDTHSLQNGQYTNDRSVTAPNGNTHTNDFAASATATAVS